MQVYALNAKDLRVFVETAVKGCDYFCIECGGTLRVRGGEQMQLHFYHLQGQHHCRLNGKSEEHLQLQQKIQQLCSNAEQEVRFTTIQRIADIVWPSKNIVFEVQCSPITAEEVRQRIIDYRSIGYDVIWILHERNFNKRKVTAAEAFLTNYTHYFAHETVIYDSYHICIDGIRRRSFYMGEINLATLQANDNREIETQPNCFQIIPIGMQKRLKNWRHYCEGDLIDAIKRKEQKENFTQIIEYEQKVLGQTKRPPYSFTKYAGIKIKKILKSIYYWVIEQSC